MKKEFNYLEVLKSLKEAREFVKFKIEENEKVMNMNLNKVKGELLNDVAMLEETAESIESREVIVSIKVADGELKEKITRKANFMERKNSKKMFRKREEVLYMKLMNL